METDMQDADKDDAFVVVAVTRDGRIYENVQKGRIRNRNRYLARLISWIGKASTFFFVRILRLSGNRKDDSKTVTRNKF